MSKVNFTKGEWNIRREQDTYEVYVKTYSNGMSFLDYVADVYEKEDAHLVAAAPELYSEIEKDIQNLYQSLCDMDSDSLQYAATEKKIERKSKLLAKARGE